LRKARKKAKDETHEERGKFRFHQS
jgi:hypothetical protein